MRNEQPRLKATPEFSEEIWLRVQIMRFLRQALLTITPPKKKRKGKGESGEGERKGGDERERERERKVLIPYKLVFKEAGGSSGSGYLSAVLRG